MKWAGGGAGGGAVTHNIMVATTDTPSHNIHTSLNTALSEKDYKHVILLL